MCASVSRISTQCCWCRDKAQRVGSWRFYWRDYCVHAGWSSIYPEVQGTRGHEQFRRLWRRGSENFVHGKVCQGICGILDLKDGGFWTWSECNLISNKHHLILTLCLLWKMLRRGNNLPWYIRLLFPKKKKKKQCFRVSSLRRQSTFCVNDLNWTWVFPNLSEIKKNNCCRYWM